MKKIVSLILVLTLIMTALVGCSKPDETKDNPEPPVTQPEDQDNDQDSAAEGGKIAKLGLGQNISIASSKDADGNDVLALGQADVTMAAVGFDADGKVASVSIDVVQAKTPYDKDLKISADIDAPVKSKKELGPDYNMKPASAIGKEWFEQMDAFEEWMIGKSVDEIKNLKVTQKDEHHTHIPDVPELTSSVTMTVQDYIAAVAEAWDNAVDATGAEKVGLGVSSSIASSKELGTDKDGKEVLPVAQSDTNMAAMAFDKDGKVVAAIVDTAQVKINFDKEGKVTSDAAAEYKTKHELKEDYNMKNASPIKKEWYEQMNAFQEWMIGKTADEITGLKVKENDHGPGIPDVPELTSSVTISVSSYLDVVGKAAANAK